MEKGGQLPGDDEKENSGAPSRASQSGMTGSAGKRKAPSGKPTPSKKAKTDEPDDGEDEDEDEDDADDDT